MVGQAEITAVAPRQFWVDAFGAAPDLRSRIHGLGGSQPPADAAYVFGTIAVRSQPGPVIWTVRFDDLRATCGTIVVQIAAVSPYPGANPVSLKAVTASLSDVVATGGVISLEFICRRNMLYSISGYIYDETDASASGAATTVSAEILPGEQMRRDRAEGGGGIQAGEMRQMAQLVSIGRPRLAIPVSQGWTPEQCEEPSFAVWMKRLCRSGGAAAENWTAAYILQVLQTYGGLSKCASGLGFGAGVDGVPALLAAEGCAVLVTAGSCDSLPEGDPGLALERLLRPEICPPGRFFENVHFTTVDLAMLPGALADFDFVWSAGIAERMASVADYVQFAEGSMNTLKSGGLAVHTFSWTRADQKIDDPHRSAFTRADIERIALALISRGHEVAQLKFGSAIKADREGRLLAPFGLVARKR